MKKKHNIYFVQVDILRKAPTFCSAYLPYAVATLWAYAKQEPIIDDAYDMKEIFFLRNPIAGTVEKMDTPFFIGFSCYCWSTEYNKKLAAAVKQAFPNCYILFGGHNVPASGIMLEEEPYIDFLIHNEGEIPLRALLRELAKEQPDFKQVPGLSYRTAEGIITNPNAIAESVEDFPSPYLDGVFDPIIKAHPEIQWSTVWETNRGCPYHCAFCDWGQHEAKVRRFTMEKLLAEIKWMADNKVEYIWCADANFGILERDEDLLDAIIAEKKRTGFPFVFLSQTTKILNDRLFKIIKKLIESGLDSLGPNLALQSLTPEVLKNIGRKNIDDETFINWLRRYREAGYRTHTDLILGLPGESLQSFCAGVEKLFVLGQHDGIQCFQCLLLPNTSMASPEFINKYKIQTTRKIFKQISEDVLEEEVIDEFVDFVYETEAMPQTDLLKATCFMILTQSIHSLGLLRYLAMYFHVEKIISYADFYLQLLDFYRENKPLLPGKTLVRLEQYIGEGLRGKESEPLEIPGFSFGRMYEEQYFFCCSILEFDRFYADTEVFLRQFNIEENIFKQLLYFQRESIVRLQVTEKTLDFEYDFPAYFEAIYNNAPISLQKKKIRLRFTTEFDVSTPEKYYEFIVFRGKFSSRAFYKTEYIDIDE